MHKTLRFFLGLIFALGIPAVVFGSSEAILHHELQTVLDPATHQIQVKD